MRFLLGFEKFWSDIFNFFFVGTNWYAVGYGVGVFVFIVFCVILLFGIVFSWVSWEEKCSRKASGLPPHKPKIKGY